MIDRKTSHSIRLFIFFKDFSHWCRSSCVGLNVAGYTTAAYLRGHGIKAHAQAVRHNIDVFNDIDKHRPTHVVISAPWLSLYDLRALVTHFRHIKFVVLSHSNVGYSHADLAAIELMRLYARLSHHHKNLNVGGNSYGYVEWFHEAYGEKAVLLPNLYPLKTRVSSKTWDGGTLKIGSFGALRPEKNFITAAAATILIGRRLDVPTELHMSSGGEDCRSQVLRAIEEMVEGLDWLKLIRHHWMYWDEFIRVVRRMDLMMQPSFTESFNMITADAISVGVPVVASPPIYWAPESWKANPDDVMDVARVGIELLTEDQGEKGSRSLLNHDRRGLTHWMRFLLDS